MMSTEVLFKPLLVNNLELKNRIVLPAMSRESSPGGIPNDATTEYYRQRAAGGTGLIITEGSAIDRKAAINNVDMPNLYEPAAIEGWKKTVNAVHQAGAKIASQIWHQGISRKNGTGPYPDAPTEGPSAFGADSVEMSEEDIADTVDAFAKAAKIAQDIGYDAVEVHGAHGFLVDQFLWEKTNRRSDAYGGSIEKRTKFATEVIRAMRKSVGPSFPIMLRFSQFKMEDVTAKLAQSPQELATLLEPISAAGVDIFHASTRRYWEPEFEGSDLNIAGWTKKITGKTTISIGSVGLSGADVFGSLQGETTTVGDLSNLIDRMGANEFDLVAIGRAQVNDPEWTNKVREGRFSELTPFTKESLKNLGGAEIKPITRN
ncbi:NADH:flavin oxidoreductase [Silvibacterium acidisoli]|uniref:NADH:flavin oxidoreductase n=1 Tax=Acidobacteriaceae bacterium ZG23-2 TaxID=2883246 RepID=UPI00406C8396